MTVAQYSVHAAAGLEPGYGIHLPNIRSPEDWQKDDARAPGIMLNVDSPASPEWRSNRLHTHSANVLNLLADVCAIFVVELPITIIQKGSRVCYYFNLN
jgi:hypothetical protein